MSTTASTASSTRPFRFLGDDESSSPLIPSSPDAVPDEDWRFLPLPRDTLLDELVPPRPPPLPRWPSSLSPLSPSLFSLLLSRIGGLISAKVVEDEVVVATPSTDESLVDLLLLGLPSTVLVVVVQRLGPRIYFYSNFLRSYKTTPRETAQV